MIAAATDSDCVFLGEAQTGNGFTGIDDLCLGAGDGVDKGRGTGGDARQ